MKKSLKTALIKATGEVSIKTYNSFAEMQKQVGGYIQAFSFGENATAYVNEDGIAKNLPPNFVATMMCKNFHVGVGISDFIKGNMIVLGNVDNDGDETSIPETVLEEILRLSKET